MGSDCRLALGLYLSRLAASTGFSPQDLSWFGSREVAARKFDAGFKEAAERCWQVKGGRGNDVTSRE